MSLNAAADVEAYVADVHHALTTPLDRECLVCYLLRTSSVATGHTGGPCAGAR